jgi:hypothetical protein
MIGGLALLCFTKAFSIVFLGNSRTVLPDDIHERGFLQLMPMYLTVSLMITIGFFPSFFIKVLESPVNLFTHDIIFNFNLLKVGAIDSLKYVSLLFFVFIVFVALIFFLRKLITRNRIIETGTTWGCGYVNPGSRFQYSANSFVRSYSKLAKPMLEIEKEDVEIQEVFPAEKHFTTEPYDKIEKIFIDKPLRLAAKISEFFLFLQSGHLQRYILYGIIFITGVICIPLIFDKIVTLFHFLNNL